MMLRLPPKIKVLEALGCIGDKRINILNDKEAEVISSDGSRRYRVYVDLSSRKVYSDDNGTKYRGYIGYPIIAFLMLKGVLPYDENLSRALASIPWKILNERYKKYEIVEKIVLNKIKSQGIDEAYAVKFVNNVLTYLRNLRLEYLSNPNIGYQ